MSKIDELINIGFSNHQEGKLEDAEIAYREALSLDSENADLCNLMGVLKLQQAETTSAIELIEKAYSLKPCEYYLESLFQAYIRSENFQKLVSYRKEVIKNYPKSFSLFFNLALAYRNLNQNDKAIDFYNRALNINPASHEAWFNLAHLYSIEGQNKNAISAYKICRKLKPDDRETNYFLSIALMKAKKYQKGFKLFENRLCRQTATEVIKKTYPNLGSDKRLWKGENIKNKTILVYYEAGFGDVIMFSRYLRLLKQRCKKIIFYPQKQLVPLFEKSNLGIDEILEGFIPEQELDFDVHVPLLSLPYLLKLDDTDVFKYSEGYLNADENLVEEYRKKYFAQDEEKYKVGIKWQGNTYYDKDRVIPTESFFPLIETEGTKFYSFQTFEGSEEVKKLTDKYDVVDIGKDLIDFGQTAAAIKNLDAIICNDTSLAHLAGALDIPCLVVLPYDVNWRWHTGEGACEWYDSVRLVRQSSPGDWKGVFELVKEILDRIMVLREEDINENKMIIY